MKWIYGWEGSLFLLFVRTKTQERNVGVPEGATVQVQMCIHTILVYLVDKTS